MSELDGQSRMVPSLIDARPALSAYINEAKEEFLL